MILTPANLRVGSVTPDTAYLGTIELPGVPETPLDFDGVRLDDFTAPDTWSNGVGTQTRTFLNEDTPAMKLVGVSSNTSFHKALAFDLTDQAVTIKVRRNANVYRLRVELVVGGTSYGTKRWVGPYVYENALPLGEYVTLTFPLADFEPAGTAPPTVADFADVRDVFVFVNRHAAGDADIDFAELRRYPQTPADGPGVIWTFDDARLDTYTFAYPRLAAIGHVGVIGVPTNMLGGVSLGDGAVTMSLAQLQELAAAGWQACAHGHNHINLEGASQATIEAELDDSYAWLIANGFDADGAAHYVYPGGGYDDTVTAETLARYRSARTTREKRAEIPNVANFGRLMCRYVTNTRETTYVTDAMDRVAARGGVMIVALHSFFPTAPANQWNWYQDRFEAVVAHADSLGLMSYTLADMYQG